MKLRLIEPKSINLIDSDYEAFGKECKMIMPYDGERNSSLDIKEYKGLLVAKSKGIDCKSFVSVIQVHPVPKLSEEERLDNFQYTLSKEDYFEFI